jgi:hypothetical protein
VNLTDLRDELETRSTPDGDLLGATRLAGVQGHIRAIRRRRVAGVAAAIAVVAAIVVGYGVLPRSTALPQPAVRPTPTGENGFPEYASGARLLTTGTASLRGTITLTATPGPRGFLFTNRCSLDDDDLMIEWRVNGHSLGGSSCSTGGGTHYWHPEEFWAEIGVRPGQPATLVASVKRWGRSASKPIPDGTFAVAVMDRMRFEDYPLPPRPAELKPFSEVAGNLDQPGAIARVESDPDDPNATVAVRVAIPAGASLQMAAQTPGTMRVLVDGMEAAANDWWSYDLGLSNNSLREGEKGTRTVTVTFVPRYMTGAWRAVIYPHAP